MTKQFNLTVEIDIDKARKAIEVKTGAWDTNDLTDEQICKEIIQRLFVYGATAIDIEEV